MSPTHRRPIADPQAAPPEAVADLQSASASLLAATQALRQAGEEETSARVDRVRAGLVALLRPMAGLPR